MSQKVLLTSKEVHIILHRLACQLIENHLDFSNTILIGLQPRGKFLAERIKQILESEYQVSNIQLGFLDIASRSPASSHYCNVRSGNSSWLPPYAWFR